MDVNKFVKPLTPVTNPNIFTSDDKFTESGLFSEKIFGLIDTIDRRKTFSYINLNCYIIHPTLFKILKRLNAKIELLISGEKKFIVEDGKVIEDDNGYSGIEFLRSKFSEIKFRGETNEREKLIKLINKSYEEDKLFIKYVIVIPPDYRNIFQDKDGNWIIDPLNDIYSSIIRKSNQIATTNKGVFYDLLNFSIQKYVIQLDEAIKSKIQKKSGIIRGQLLGKRVDFSGRAVITPDPSLDVDQIGIPLRLAVSLFEPFIIHVLAYKTDKEKLSEQLKLYRNLDLSVDSIKSILKDIRKDNKLPQELYDIIFHATEIAMHNRYVVAKRDPVLHAESYRAYKPILVKGDTIRMSTTQVGSHNADFDGDQMAIIHPISNEAQEEIKQKMTRAFSGTGFNQLVFSLSKEMWVGLYIITKSKSKNNSPIQVSDDDLDKITDPYIMVKYRGKNLTAGRAIVSSVFPQEYIINDIFTKSYANKLIIEVSKKYPEKVVKDVVSKLEKIGFKWSTIMSPSLTIDDLELPKQIEEYKKKIYKEKNLEKVEQYIEEAKKLLKDHLRDTGIGDLVESGSTKGWDQPTQILIAKGIVKDPDGKLLEPVKKSFSEGLTSSDFFKASSGARAGIIDRVINTSDTGYMSRKLAYILNSVEKHPTLKDCGTNMYLKLKLTNEMIKRLNGRYIVLSNGSIVSTNGTDQLKVGNLINLRSPIFCKSPKICHLCYGDLVLVHRTPYIGILAAQVIGEVGTQFIMKTFHTGGATKLIKRDVIQDIISNEVTIELSQNIDKYLYSKDNILYTKKPCKIILLQKDYDKETLKIDEVTNKLWVKVLVSKIVFDDLTFNLILDYNVEIFAEDITITKEVIEINFDSGYPIISLPLEFEELKQQIRYVERLLSGKEVLNKPEQLIKKLLDIYKKSSMDLVHLEVLVSQVLRYSKDISYPARLGPTWDPVMVNIKEIVFSESFIQGLEFENINKALLVGLTSDVKREPSILEKALTGE